MSETTKIEWCDSTFNPWEGCQKVGPGCDHCYAETRNARFGGGVAVNWGPGAPRRRTSEANWRKPLAWNAAHAEFFAEHGRRQRVFCASLADVFDNEVPEEWRIDLFDLIRRTPNLDWLLLTKRIGNARPMIATAAAAVEHDDSFVCPWTTKAPWPNVWIGATITSQTEAERDIPKLLAVPAAKRFLSMEPLLGPVNLTDVPMPESGHGHHEFSPIITGSALKRAQWHKPSIDWVIVGGESGPNARPMHPDWARSLRDQCQAAGVPFLFKQWGEWVDADHGPNDDAAYEGKSDCWAHIEGGHHSGEMGVDFFNTYPMYRVGKKAAGRLLDGREWNEVSA